LGFNDTIIPVDYEINGQINSNILYCYLVSALPLSSTLFIIFNYYYSSLAIKLPFVYRANKDGNINLVNNVKQSIYLMSTALHLLKGGFTYNKVNNIRKLLTSA